MIISKCTMKFCRLLPFLAGLIVFGCTSLQQQQNIWPWEYGKEHGNHQTGDYIAITAGVANFGEVPKAVKPVTSESLGSHLPDAHSPSETAAAHAHQPVLPAESKPGSGKTERKAKREYDFTVSDIKIEPPSYLPINSVRTAYNITAFNHGNAPVSVALGIDPNSTQNLSTDKPLPLTLVVPPKTDQTVAHFEPKMKAEAYKFNYRYTWSVGDYTANHQCPEQYQFPFGGNTQAFASVNDNANATPFTRYAVIFTMPAGSPVLVARKGIVIQIMADDKIDILHDDSTIATYSHLGKIAESVTVGKVVSTEDIIGTAGATGNRKEAFMQLTVWRPEPPPFTLLKTNSTSLDFALISFPLKFCSKKSNKCRILTRDQSVSRSKLTEKKKPKKSRVINKKG
jgi:hypothetical protein